MSTRFDKIKTYNQVLLAIAGTLTLLFFLIVGIIFLEENFRHYFADEEVDSKGILAKEETDILLADSLRKQLISFNKIDLIDSVNNIYILPIKQANINEEPADDQLVLINRYGKNKFNSYSEFESGIFNNLVIYESLNNESSIVFNTKISISDYFVIENDNIKYILITGTDKDSNKDKYLNKVDLQELYVYNLKKKSLSKLKSKENFTTLTLLNNFASKDIFGKFGIDRNNNGQFEYGIEPIVFYKVDLESNTLVKIIQDKQIDTLQNLLEGR